MLALWGVAAVATLMDLHRGKIKNEIILLGYLLGLISLICQGRPEKLFYALSGLLFPIVLLYPIFLIRGLGAGDIKLFSVIGCFLSYKDTFYCILLAFLIGGIISLFKLFFLKVLLHSGKPFSQYTIHFSVPISLSLILITGGIR